ncbi:hypothetical protein LTV02_02985 [Nocardia yamanashiensis]|uniref:hypothetical protein n=1 Tax=Nocardia yamanashiensis TaxID=209247 RepID=UPI001E63CF89|nr:hypothetical protein [Nocardia yamanashiensis]UGT42400.1 hypothetical protein LTV02_02985 [Nocardia yamanashiensis]
MRAYRAVLVVALAAFTLTACSSSEPARTGPFDPCTEISDAVFKDARYDPASKKTTQTVTGRESRCTLSGTTASDHGSLMLEHPNTVTVGLTYDYFLASAQSGGTAATVTKVNGRDAYLSGQGLLGCTITLRTATSALSLTVSDHHSSDCPAAERVAAKLEPSIGSR